jgi:DNA-directed RNA polymerase subunit RPC12/RpoP
MTEKTIPFLCNDCGTLLYVLISEKDTYRCLHCKSEDVIEVSEEFAMHTISESLDLYLRY